MKNESERLADLEEVTAHVARQASLTDARVNVLVSRVDALCYESPVPAPSPETPEAIAERVVNEWYNSDIAPKTLGALLARAIRADRVRRTVGPEYDAEGEAKQLVRECGPVGDCVFFGSRGDVWAHTTVSDRRNSLPEIQRAVAAMLREAHAAGAAGRAIKGGA